MVDLRGRLKIVVPNFSTNPSANTTLSPGRSGLKEVNMKIGQILGTFFLLTSTIQK